MKHVNLSLLVSLILLKSISTAQQDDLNIPLLLAQLLGLTSPSPSHPDCEFDITVSSDFPFIVEPPPSHLPGTRCTWHLHALNGFQVRLQFQELNLVCPDNYLFIGNTGGKGKRYCETPSSAVSLGKDADLMFESGAHSNAWFRIRAFAVQSRVTILTALSKVQNFTSPNYPDGYPNDHAHGWIVKNGVEGGILLIDCRKGFILEEPIGNSCIEDFLAVSVSDNPRFPDRRYCGRSGPGLLATKTKITFLFRSGLANNFPGFKCFYQSIVSDKPELPDKEDECHCGQANLGKRVVGGVQTQIHEYPWQAGISTRTGYLFCGGTLINDRYVLTAAHCTRGRSSSSLIVLLGEHDTTTDTEAKTIKIDVAEIIRHPRYDTVTNDNDIALLRLKKKVKFDVRMKPPCFTRPGVQYMGQEAVVTGWGAIKEGGKVTGILREVTLPILPLEKCRRAYGKDLVTENMLCAGIAEGGKDSCQGDSGGPMVWEYKNRWHLIGIVSWGYGCARPNTPGVYTRVDKYLRWIDQNTRSATYC